MATTDDPRSRWPPLALAGWAVLFLAAAVLNAGGYRYGASDQAFYIPAVLHHLDPSLFPRDWALLVPQDRFSVFPAAAAALARAARLDVPPLFLGLYVAGLLALFAGAVGIGARLYRSRWTVLGLVLALTLRHAVALGAVNTLEGYMHPRLLAFGIGSLAVAACLASRPWLAVAFVAVAAVCHPTTAVWFLLWVGVAWAVADRRLARPALALAAAGALVAGWAVVAGPLAGRLVPMDGPWLDVLASKKYLFPTKWPVSGWIPALLTPAVGGWLFVLRRRRGLVTPAETGVAAGAATLFAAFLVSIPLTAAHVALAVQLQIPRTLWMVDLLAVVYLVWYLAEGAPWARGDRAPGRGPRAAQVTAVVLLALSIGRGVYVMFVEHRGRPPVQVGLPADDWNDALRWVDAHTAPSAWVLATPGHAWRYGTSVRVAARRDVFLEETKDSALAIYSRETALRVLGRIREGDGFDEWAPDRLRGMPQDVLVTERQLDLPLLHTSGRFRVYGLK